jgi:myo-inositol-1(or 4)-monophosphatase
LSNPDALLPLALEAVELAADIVRTHTPGLLTAKGDRDYTSEVDYAVEQKVRAFLHERSPDAGFLGEEEGVSGDNYDRLWAFDPIDGTVNFAHAIPLCGVSLAFLDSGQPVVGVIDLPLFGSRYTAIQGGGAYSGPRRIRVSETSELANAVVTLGDFGVGVDATERNKLQQAILERLAARVLRVRMLGSAAIDLAWLAEGKTDASITLSNRPWDVAAGVLIAREAGANVFDLDGSDHSTQAEATIAATPTLTADLQALLSANSP